MSSAEDISSHVDVKYEAWANREQVIGEHLRTLYEAQDALSEIVSIERLGTGKGSPVSEHTAWWAFFKKASKLFQQAKPKILKMKGLDDKKAEKEKKKEETTQVSGKKKKFALDYERMLDAVTKASDHMFTGEGGDITIKEYRDVIEQVSLLYDKLGYSAAERKITRTGFLSDIQVPTEEAEGLEMASID